MAVEHLHDMKITFAVLYGAMDGTAMLDRALLDCSLLGVHASLSHVSCFVGKSCLAMDGLECL